jgi:hypothetical protein
LSERHDVRYDMTAHQVTIVPCYGALFVECVERYYCLLTQYHHFLLSYCVNQGWAKCEVLNFFLKDFVLHQFPCFAEETLFVRHYHHLKHFTSFVSAEAPFCRPLQRLLSNSDSIMEIPSGFIVFGCRHIQLCATPADVHVVVHLLQIVQSVPDNFRQFLEPKEYLSPINYSSFWCCVFPRHLSVVEGSDIWRKVVFNERLNDFVHGGNADFEQH